MEHSIRLRFDSSIKDIKEVNESFSSGVLRICYIGVNENHSMISKEAINRALPTIFNCPVVCNYDIESDSIGGHDIELVRTDDGGLRIVNLTSAIGVVPVGATTWYEVCEDSDEEHEYLTTEVILWKRSPVYQKIVNDGITSQSMEISVKNGHQKNGVLEIEDFTFTAFCLLGEGITPCFESASLQVFNKDELEQQFANMMKEFKETFAQNYLGGGKDLKDKMALLAEYGLNIEQLDFKLDDFSIDELRKKFEAMKHSRAADGPGKFALEGPFREELVDVLMSEQIETPWGTDSRYWFWDYDSELSEVYGNDITDWNIYGFTYSMDGDHVLIDFASKKRMKLALVPFDEGSQGDPVSGMFTKLVEKYSANDKQWETKYQKASDTIQSMESELDNLRKFKADAENANAKSKREEIFARFENLSGIEAFDNLREHSTEYSIDDLEEKLFAILGRNSQMPTKFSHGAKLPKLPIEKQHEGAERTEPYGGVFSEYGILPCNRND